MATRDCIAAMNIAAGRKLSDEETLVVSKEIMNRVKERKLLNAAEGHDASVRAAVDSYSKDMAAAAVIEKRNSAINLKVRLQALDKILTQYPDDFAAGIQAWQVGRADGRKGSRLSTAQAQNSFEGEYLGGFYSDVEKAGLWKEFVSGAFDRDISDVLEAINRDVELPITAGKEAETLGRLIADWEEKIRLDANRHGGWIKKLEGFIVKQSHDPYKIKSAGFEKWRDDILPKLDAVRTFKGEPPEPFLKAAYDGLSSGIHLTTSSGQPTGLKGAANVAKKVSASRTLHFKQGEWFDYNTAYGHGSLHETVPRMFQHSAMTNGLMQRMGPNAEANRMRVIEKLKRQLKGDPDKLQAFAQATDGYLKSEFMELDGSTRRPVNQMGATIVQSLRALQTTAKLGGVLLAQLGDLPIYASDFRYQDGSGYLSGIADGMSKLLQRRGSVERRELAGMLGIFSDSMNGQISSRFFTQDNDVPGRMSKLVQLTFKYGGATAWSDRLRLGAAESMAHRLSYHVGKSFDQLGEDLVRTLGIYGIGDAEWNAIRQAQLFEANGNRFVVPENVEVLPDSVIETLLHSYGTKPTPTRIANTRRDIAESLRTYYVDRAHIALLSPDQKTRAITNRGTRPGTVEGEFFRSIFQFKSFMVAYGHKAVAREVYGRGANSFREAMTSGNGEFLGLMQLLLWTTTFGFMSMAAKQLAKGKTPRDPKDYKTWLAAMTQGGGFGLYGDFLFGEVSRFGQSPIVSFAGPVAGMGADVVDVYQRFLNGDDFAAKALRTTINNTPFLNLFYARPLLDYLFLNRLQETMNPGALRRMERRVKKETGQDFLLRPSQYLGA